ncbi:MAG: YkgJ family cysteine cluster protein [Thermoprotei archaeon]|nr:MAG: YkgJ family cysteine cluster protein [Thermoprotei archaeon]
MDEDVHRITKKGLAGDTGYLRAVLSFLWNSGVPVAKYTAYALVYQYSMNILLDTAQDCSRCGGRCCREGHPVPLYPFDVDELRRNLGDDVEKKLIKVGNGYALPRPCPFQSGWRCSIHSFKPYACLCYPFATEDEQIDNMKRYNGEGLPVLSIPSDCPAAKRVYETVTSIARELKKKLLRDPAPTELLDELIRRFSSHK